MFEHKRILTTLPRLYVIFHIHPLFFRFGKLETLFRIPLQFRGIGGYPRPVFLLKVTLPSLLETESKWDCELDKYKSSKVIADKCKEWADSTRKRAQGREWNVLYNKRHSRDKMLTYLKAVGTFANKILDSRRTQLITCWRKSRESPFCRQYTQAKFSVIDINSSNKQSLV